MTFVLFERKKYHELDKIVYHTQWMKVASFSSRNKIKEYIKNKTRLEANWEYKIENGTI